MTSGAASSLAERQLRSARLAGRFVSKSNHGRAGASEVAEVGLLCQRSRPPTLLTLVDSRVAQLHPDISYRV
ncbi:hypothetical protein E4T50_15289 [Aureobasidium sp. EXF-12298]|nr:hypothetical protein E4T50_15289 [Aureobasidium sp. EXF-12298]